MLSTRLNLHSASGGHAVFRVVTRGGSFCYSRMSFGVGIEEPLCTDATSHTFDMTFVFSVFELVF